MATRKNPKDSLPSKWTTAQVRVNPQGKVQVKIARNKVRRNVAMGFYDSTGFHPIRKSRDYDPDRAEGDEYTPPKRKRKGKKRKK